MHKTVKSAVATLFLISGLLAGCTGDPLPNAHKDYAERLERVLATPIAQPQYAQLPEFPDAASLRQSPQAIAIKLSEFYALENCQIASEVAARNTALGKTQLPSQRFSYELKLIKLLSDCAETHGHSIGMQSKLQNWLAQKRSAVTLNWANVLLTSKATHLAFSHAPSLLTQTSNQTLQSAINAFAYLTPTQVDESFDTAALEQQLQLIEQTRLPVKLWQSQTYIQQHFSLITPQLELALNEIACPQGRAGEQAKILRNVFYLFFIEQIQPIGSVINRAHYQMQPIVDRWLVSTALPEHFKQYVASVHVDGFDRYQAAMTRHVKVWQQFLARCNLSPVAPN